jgi:hypothetical protein
MMPNFRHAFTFDPTDGRQRQRGNVLDTLRYYHAAGAVKHTEIPVPVEAARTDQIAVHNALAGPKSLAGRLEDLAQRVRAFWTGDGL